MKLYAQERSLAFIFSAEGTLRDFKQMTYTVQFILQEGHSAPVWRKGCSGSRVDGNETRRLL